MLQGDFGEGFQFFFRAHHLGASLMDVELHHLFTGHRTGVPDVDFHRQAVRLIEHVSADPQVRVGKRRVTQAEPEREQGDLLPDVVVAVADENPFTVVGFLIASGKIRMAAF